MKKNIVLCFVILSVLLNINLQKAYSAPSVPAIKAHSEITVDENKEKLSENEIIKRFSFKNKFQKSPEAQITSFLKKYNHYSETNNFKKLKELYADNFVNNDGFNKETIFEMIKMASGSYKNMKYNTEIKQIDVNGKYAVVRAFETATAQSDSLSSKINDTGSVYSEIEYVDYLIKEGNNWKIMATDVISEEVTMKYGEAKSMDIKINSPLCVPEGSQYEVSITANTPDGSFALGSIVNEQIVFPQVESKDVFKVIKSEKLSRVLTANKDNHNEYTTISIALTRAEVEPPAVNINMTGAAFAMKRINVLSYKDANKEKVNTDVSKK